jgi:hypothetical protein
VCARRRREGAKCCGRILSLVAKGDADETAISVEIPSCAVTLRWQAPLPLFELKRNNRRLVLFQIKR